ncbi:MAG: ribulose-phosphate 3-epimerase [Candidatus Heimdallarchaeota archaeon]|nr:ribulose-phosphate 3-epimerase [Candidatus Heimdallarchaeota archaeon]
MNISGSLLAANFSNLADELKFYDQIVDSYHIDVMDGNFVNNIAFGPALVQQIHDLTYKDMKIHFYMNNFHDIFPHYLPSRPKTIFPHIESDFNFDRLIEIKEKYKINIGFAISPQTNLDLLNSYLEDINEILILAVNPGFGGQKFLPTTFDRIKKLMDIRDQNTYKFEITIDGGVNEFNIHQLNEFGVHEVVIGSALFNKSRNQDLLLEIQKLR